MTHESERGAYFHREMSLNEGGSLGSSEHDRDTQDLKHPHPGSNPRFPGR